MMVSAVFQNISGRRSRRTTRHPTRRSGRRSAATWPRAGAPLTCSATATVPLIAPQTMFDDRLTRLDLRIGKRFLLSQRMRLQANLNVYNVFNGSASSVLNVNYGPLWLQPSLLQDGRMLQFSGSLTF